MLLTSPARRALVAFVLSVLLAMVASAVCVAFGAGAIPSLTPYATVAAPQPEPAAHQERDARLSLELGRAATGQASVPAQRPRLGS